MVPDKIKRMAENTWYRLRCLLIPLGYQHDWTDRAGELQEGIMKALGGTPRIEKAVQRDGRLRELGE